MWIYDKHDNIINLDYIKAIHVDESKTFDSLGYSGLKKICGLCGRCNTKFKNYNKGF